VDASKVTGEACVVDAPGVGRIVSGTGMGGGMGEL
jgi:hypothetical protein